MNEVYRNSHAFESGQYVAVYAIIDDDGRGQVRMSAGADMEIPDALAVAASLVEAARELVIEGVGVVQ